MVWFLLVIAGELRLMRRINDVFMIELEIARPHCESALTNS